MKFPFLSVLGPIGALAIVLSPTATQAEPTYDTFNYPDGPNGNLITGIRGYDNAQDLVFITGSYETGVAGNTQSLLFQGSATTQVGTWRAFNPDFGPSQTVTSSTLYGPNTFLYDPSLGAGGVRAVGSYKYSQSADPAADHGFIYEGTISGGTVTQIDAPSTIVSGTAVINTIAHSTMGKLVVGNFDTQLNTGHAFIYNLAPTGEQEQWINFNPTENAVSVTAYGIWQNGNTDIYTIVGGYSDLNRFGVDAGYMVDYNLADGTWDNYKSFQFQDEPLTSLISHFDGITLADDGSFHLTGDQISIETGEELGFFASVRRNEDGTFGEAVWTSIEYPEALVTSGNTVYKDKVLGIFEDGINPTQSYVATVPEPSTWALLGLGGAVALAAWRKRRGASAA